MNIQEIRLARACFREHVVSFSYFKDKYALQLLSYELEKKEQQSISISALKKGEKAFLLNKKPLKDITSKTGGNQMQMSDLQNYRQENTYYFDLTFTNWGRYKKHRKNSYYQTTRPGYNLVVQLNCDVQHEVKYYQWIRPKEKDHPFMYCSHPVKKNGKITLAWARLDYDLNTGEVLIEEIQNDWIRECESIYKHLSKIGKKNKKRWKNYWLFHDTNTTFQLFEQYYNYLQIYKKFWEEAMLSATLEFCKSELGISTIYYHTHESGKKLKSCNPPKSIYTKLPKRFGFKETTTAPKFIQNCQYLKKTLRKNEFKWWKLEI